MSKDPTPKADGLRAMREETRGHLQATVAADGAGIDVAAGYVEGAKALMPLPSKKLMPSKKLIAYAGKERHQGAVPFSKTPRPSSDKPPRNRRKYKRKIS